MKRSTTELLSDFFEIEKNYDLINEVKERNKKKSFLKESRRIAIQILEAIDNKGISQKDLADKMDVSPQYVNKLVKGGENLTLETIIKIQDVLNIRILDSFKEKTPCFNVGFKYSFKGHEYSTYNPESDNEYKMAE